MNCIIDNGYLKVKGSNIVNEKTKQYSFMELVHLVWEKTNIELQKRH